MAKLIEVKISSTNLNEMIDKIKRYEKDLTTKADLLKTENRMQQWFKDNPQRFVDDKKYYIWIDEDGHCDTSYHDTIFSAGTVYFESFYTAIKYIRDILKGGNK